MEPVVRLVVEAYFIRYPYCDSLFGESMEIVIPDEVLAQIPDVNDLYVFTGYVPLVDSTYIEITNDAMGFMVALSNMSDDLGLPIGCKCTIIDHVSSVLKYRDVTLFADGDKPDVDLLGNGAASMTFMLSQQK